MTKKTDAANGVRKTRGIRPEMRPLTGDETAQLAGYLADWRTPEEVHGALQAVGEVAGFYTVGQGALKIWREAFVAMSCLQLSHARRLRLGDDPPDFELEYDHGVQDFELVDVLPAGRRLGEVYKTYARNLNETGRTELERVGGQEEHEALLADFERQLLAKMAKGYETSLILVADIHHELEPGSDYPMEQRLARIAQAGLDRFREVWIRKGASIIRVSPFGMTRMSGIGPQDD